MMWFWFTMPLMILATAIATVPVLYHSIKEDRRLRAEHEAILARLHNGEFLAPVVAEERIAA